MNEIAIFQKNIVTEKSKNTLKLKDKTMNEKLKILDKKICCFPY